MKVTVLLQDLGRLNNSCHGGMTVATRAGSQVLVLFTVVVEGLSIHGMVHRLKNFKKKLVMGK